MKPTKILYAEDEIVLAEIILENLRDEGYVVLHAESGLSAYNLFLSEQPDLVILDVMLPDMNGLELAKRIRSTNSQIPILFLTSRSQPENVVEGFRSGGSDYIKKPFSIKELLVRIEVLSSPQRFLVPTDTRENALVPIGTYAFDPNKLLLSRNGKQRELTPREAEILKLLILHKNKITERSALLNSMWGNEDFFTGRSLDVFITKLRKYLSDDPSVQIITVRGIGYKLSD